LLIVNSALLLTAWFVLRTYNRLIILRNKVRVDYSDIDVQLHKRSSLVQNLVDMVKEYAKHENSTFKQVAKARSAVDTSKNAREAAEADNELTKTLRSLMMVTEAYPELKADTSFQNMRADLMQIEGDIARYREEYNQTVTTFNNQVQTFPNLLVANLLTFEEAVLFQPGSSEVLDIKGLGEDETKKSK